MRKDESGSVAERSKSGRYRNNMEHDDTAAVAQLEDNTWQLR